MGIAYMLRMRSGKPGGGKGALIYENISGTLTTSNDAVAFFDGEKPRRLTPTECERLQGFPDGYTEIPYKGKPKEECPITSRYKALGNSMAVPVIRWIGEQIEKVDALE